MKAFSKINLTIGLIVLAIGFFSFITPKPDSEFKNLKVLPKDISSHDLDSLMHMYTIDLGVGCDFCHAKDKNKPDDLDFVSDELHAKEEAREMITMTLEINKTYFKYDPTKKRRPKITCYTCHNGHKEPVRKKPETPTTLPYIKQ